MFGVSKESAIKQIILNMSNSNYNKNIGLYLNYIF